jgi:hypothetical protein
MRSVACNTLISLALGALVAACHSPKTPSLVTGDAATATAKTGATDAFWMIALPPVTVYARPPARAANDSVGARLAPTEGRLAKRARD